MNKKRKFSKIILLILSIFFIISFVFIFAISILVVIFQEYDNIAQDNLNKMIPFFHWLSEFDAINNPFSIYIDVLTSIGGVFFGIRIGQWIDAKEEKEKLSELWKKTNTFLKLLKKDINKNNISIYELAEYNMYWDALQRANSVATRFLQDDNRYVEISFVFSFLAFYKNSWKNYNCIEEWKANATILENNRINKWINDIDSLITYTEEKSNNVKN